jgi:hypothetical protein
VASDGPLDEDEDFDVAIAIWIIVTTFFYIAIVNWMISKVKCYNIQIPGSSLTVEYAHGVRVAGVQFSAPRLICKAYKNLSKSLIHF